MRFLRPASCSCRISNAQSLTRYDGFPEQCRWKRQFLLGSAAGNLGSSSPHSCLISLQCILSIVSSTLVFSTFSKENPAPGSCILARFPGETTKAEVLHDGLCLCSMFRLKMRNRIFTRRGCQKVVKALFRASKMSVFGNNDGLKRPSYE